MKQTLIVCMGLLLAFGSNAYTPSNQLTNPYLESADEIISFRLIKKLIVVTAYMDGKKGNFIIDTGTEKMIINERYKVGHHMPHVKVTDFGGQRIGFKENIVTFGWQKTVSQKYQARITDLSKLEEIMGISIMGYIGYDVLKSYETVLDYRQQEIYLFRLNKKGEWHNGSYLPARKRYAISLYPNDFMPYLKVAFGDQTLKFGIDTGASIHLLRKGSQKKIHDHFKALPSRVMAGFSGQKRLSTAGVMVDMLLDEVSFLPMHCVVESMVELNATLPTRLDGLLGFEFLSQYKMSINYREGKLYIWEVEGL